MAMHDIGVVAVGVVADRTLRASEDGVQIFWGSEVRGVDRVAFDFQGIVGLILIAKSADIDIDVGQAGELAGEVFDMNAGTAIVIGWVFVGVNQCIHVYWMGVGVKAFIKPIQCVGSSTIKAVRSCGQEFRSIT